MTNHVRNILRTYFAATDAEIASGMSWYADAHALALELSPDNVWTGAGVISAFSPRQEWTINVRNARRAFSTGSAFGHTPNLHTVAMMRIADRILKGEHPLDVMKGDKTRAFASAIADPEGSKIATIDRHAYDIAMGAIHTDSERKIGKVVFRELSAAYVEAASLAGIGVAPMQAITWVTHKRMKGHKVNA